jgi:hypothetical protein
MIYNDICFEITVSDVTIMCSKEILHSADKLSGGSDYSPRRRASAHLARPTWSDMATLSFLQDCDMDNGCVAGLV